jgi:hypothetical protein
MLPQEGAEPRPRCSRPRIAHTCPSIPYAADLRDGSSGGSWRTRSTTAMLPWPRLVETWPCISPTSSPRRRRPMSRAPSTSTHCRLRPQPVVRPSAGSCPRSRAARRQRGPLDGGGAGTAARGDMEQWAVAAEEPAPVARTPGVLTPPQQVGSACSRVQTRTTTANHFVHLWMDSGIHRAFESKSSRNGG